MDKYLLINLLLMLSSMVIAQQKILRLSCRREALFKIGQRNHVLTGTSSHILHKEQKRSLKKCAKRCTDFAGCMSFIFVSNITILNCQLLNKEIAGLTSTDIEHSAGWNIYEPVVLITSRCQGNTCNAGTRCTESCQTFAGYKCEDINECESNPCKNGGTCNNLVNAYSCSCTAGWTGVNCEKEIMGTIKSLYYPSTYPNGHTQSWILEVTSGRVQITFNDFNTESCCDKVVLRNGRYSSSPIIATLSGSVTSGSSYVSTGNAMHVRFTTDGSVVRGGWKATWTRHD